MKRRKIGNQFSLSVADIFDAIRPLAQTPQSVNGQQQKEIKPEQLEVPLFEYQQKTVQWMIDQELGSFKGGILAEETGLGKTVELIALNLLNRPTSDVLCNKSTLILCPEVIVKQWLFKIEMLAPVLTTHVMSNESEAQDFADKDIVMVSYEWARGEYYRMQPDNQRSRRSERVYDRPRSLLDGQLNGQVWWRLISDEAQMIETYNKASLVTRSILRMNTWASTGTPFSTSQQLHADIQGMLSFIGLEDQINKNTDTDYDQLVLQLLKQVMRRNTKSGVSDQIKLPKQHHYTHYVYFDDVERHYYDSLVLQMNNDINDYLSYQDEDDDYQDYVGQEVELYSQMAQSWMTRLRQTCVHYQVGLYNQRLFGTHYKSVHEALQILYESQRSELYSSMRNLKNHQMKQGLYLEMKHRWDDAISLYENIIKFTEQLMIELKDDLKKQREQQNSDLTDDQYEVVTEFDQEDHSCSNFSQMAQARVNSWQSLRYQVYFCLASVHSHLEEKYGIQGGKDRGHALYAKSEEVRAELMSQSEQKVLESIQDLKHHHHQNDMNHTKPAMIKQIMMKDPQFGGGIRSRSAYDNLRHASQWLNRQILLLLSYREGVYAAAFKDLHTDYVEDVKAQELGHLFQDYYHDALSIRRQMLTGNVQYQSIKASDRANQIRRQMILAANDQAAVPAIQLFADGDNNGLVDLKSILQQFKHIVARFDVADAELKMCQLELNQVQDTYKQQVKFLDTLEAELPKLQRLWNRRVVFYRTLQKLSDLVALPEIDALAVDGALVECMHSQQNIQNVINQKAKKLRYLQSLVEASSQNSDSEINQGSNMNTCYICREPLGTSVMVTECGHCFDQKCLSMWLKHKQACPICVRPANSRNIKIVEQIPALLQEQSSSTNSGTNSASAQSLFPMPTYLPKLYKLYSSKISLIVKHILYLIKEDRHVKCLVFGYWGDVLRIMGNALADNDVKFLQFDSSQSKRNRDNAIQNFKDSTSVNVLLLNAKSQSAGLTLVQATHVFIVEPNINAGQEFQAQARIHRLGQLQETHVHRYAVYNTIEQSIMDLNRDYSQTYGDRRQQAQLQNNIVKSLLCQELKRLNKLPA